MSLENLTGGEFALSVGIAGVVYVGYVAMAAYVVNRINDIINEEKNDLKQHLHNYRDSEAERPDN